MTTEKSNDCESTGIVAFDRGDEASYIFSISSLSPRKIETSKAAAAHPQLSNAACGVRCQSASGSIQPTNEVTKPNDLWKPITTKLRLRKILVSQYFLTSSTAAKLNSTAYSEALSTKIRPSTIGGAATQAPTEPKRAYT